MQKEIEITLIRDARVRGMEEARGLLRQHFRALTRIYYRAAALDAKRVPSWSPRKKGSARSQSPLSGWGGTKKREEAARPWLFGLQQKTLHRVFVGAGLVKETSTRIDFKDVAVILRC